MKLVERIDDAQVQASRQSLTEWLPEREIVGRTFFDLGCGSGLSSLAAVTLGASAVVSVDYDAGSVRASSELKHRYSRESTHWEIARGDALDAAEMEARGKFDIVYSWGVLHHTGDLWRALELTTDRVRTGGWLYVSIYNDQGTKSRVWRLVKRGYQHCPAPLRTLYVALVMLPRELISLAVQVATLRPQVYVHSWTRYRANRGMSRWRDMVDWVGGFPFEVAKPEDVFEFCRRRGFSLMRLSTAGGGLGCNQFLFRLDRPDAAERIRESDVCEAK